MIQPLSGLNQIYALSIQEESQRSLSKAIHEVDINESTVLMSNKPGQGFKPNKAGQYCDYYDKPGHTRGVCF